MVFVGSSDLSPKNTRGMRKNRGWGWGRVEDCEVQGPRGRFK